MMPALDVPSVIVLLALGGGLLIGLVATVGGFLHYRRERLLTHAERLKALELGRVPPDDSYTARLRALLGKGGDGESSADDGWPGDPDRVLARKCYSSAIWVAFWGFLFGAPVASQSTAGLIALASAVGAIGVTALICGTVLASRAAGRSAPAVAMRGKPAFEPDAFDHVGTRG